MRSKATFVCLAIFVSMLAPVFGAQQEPPIEWRSSSSTAENTQMLARKIFDAPATIAVSSSAIQAGGAINARYSAYGQGLSPPLQWSSLPEGTQSVVLLMEDPDAPSPSPFLHWAVANLSPSVHALPENVREASTPLLGQDVRRGINSKGEIGYFGPRPPVGNPPHHYHFQIFALDTTLDLPDGFDRHALLQAMRGHVLAEGELIGLFQAPR